MNFLDFIQNNEITNNLNIQNQVVFENIRKGERVKIIGCKNSNLNVYKGYIGEVREYTKGQDYALIYLYPITYPTTVKFPVNHFVKL